MTQTEKSPRRAGAFAWIGLVLVFGILVSACRPSPTPTEPPAPPAPTQPPAPTPAEPVAVEPTEVEEEQAPASELAIQLVDRQWLLVGLGDAANPTVVQEGTVVTALFSPDGNLSGTGGCNNFTTSYVLEDDQLTISPIASTMMFCDQGMEQETAVMAALGSAQRIAFSPEGRLEIFYDTGAGFEQKMVFAPGETPLVDTVWVLEALGASVNPTSLERGTIITAIFSPEGNLSGSSGCNNYVAGFTAKDGLMEIQNPISTMMACTQGMEQETAYLAALAAAESYQISGSRLEIKSGDGASVLVYTSRNLTIENTLWTLVMMNGERNRAGLVPTTALFDPGSEPGKGAVGGVAMCNNYRGGYTIEADTLAISEIAATKIRCPETVIQAETTYLELLQTAQTYQVLGQTLVIIAEKGALIFVANRALLEGTYWRLNTLGDVNNPQAPVAGADFTALFVRQPDVPSGVIVGATGCNDYNATYVANLNEIKVNLPSRTNHPGCAVGLPEQEQQYFLALNAATRYRILGDNLQIFYGEGKMLNFTAFVPAPTPPPAGPLTGLNGTRWWLISMANTAVAPTSRVTAEFTINPGGATGTIFGFSGCNTYNAAIQSVFQVGPAAATKKFCAEPPGIMQLEAAYLAMLQTANSFSQAYNQLLIGTAGGVLVYYNSPGAVLPIEPPPSATAVPPATPTPELVTPEPTAEATPEPTLEPTAEPPAETEPVTAPPVAVIIASVEGDHAVPIPFDASESTSEVGITGFNWDFGDGIQAEGVTVEHTYAAPGVYTVTLTVTDVTGQTGTTYVTITIK